MLPRKLRQHLKRGGPYARRTAGQQKTERAAGDRAVASAKKKKKKKKRGPAKPKPAKTALSFYKAATRDEAKAELPEDAPNKDIAALQTKQWKALDAQPRGGPMSLAETDKARTRAALKHTRRFLKNSRPQASDADDEAASAPATQGTARGAARRAAGVPTPRAIYQELMASAGADEIIPQFQRGRAGPVPPGVAEAGAPYRARAAGRAAAPPARKRRKEAPPPPAAVLEIDEACVVCGRPTVDAAGAAEAGVLVCDGDPDARVPPPLRRPRERAARHLVLPALPGPGRERRGRGGAARHAGRGAPSKPEPEAGREAAGAEARRAGRRAGAGAGAGGGGGGAGRRAAARTRRDRPGGPHGARGDGQEARGPGDDEVLVRWESTGHCEDVALADVEKPAAGRRRAGPGSCTSAAAAAATATTRRRRRASRRARSGRSRTRSRRARATARLGPPGPT